MCEIAQQEAGMQSHLFLFFLSSSGLLSQFPHCCRTYPRHLWPKGGMHSVCKTKWAIVILGLSAQATGSRVRASDSSFPAASYSGPHPSSSAWHLKVCKSHSLNRQSVTVKTGGKIKDEVYRLGQGDAVKVTAL